MDKDEIDASGNHSIQEGDESVDDKADNSCEEVFLFELSDCEEECDDDFEIGESPPEVESAHLNVGPYLQLNLSIRM